MDFKREINIAGKLITETSPTYVIAEIGVNHNGDLALAHKLIDAAAKSGADAVKFQTYRTDALVTKGAQKADYQKYYSVGLDQYEMLNELELPFEAFTELRGHCEKIGIDFMSTAFDRESLDFVISLNPACIKWPSGELTNLLLLREATKSKLPILLSTGMGSITEIAAAVDVLNEKTQFVILQCVSNYPARIEDQNLRVLPSLKAAFGCLVGFSDHTIGPYAALVAKGLGMSVLEKHFTLDRNMKGPDHLASTEPGDFKDMIDLLRKVEKGLGDGVKRSVTTEHAIRSVVRKSLFYSRDFPAGHKLNETDLVGKRPGNGIDVKYIHDMIGKTLRKDVLQDEMVKLSDV